MRCRRHERLWWSALATALVVTACTRSDHVLERSVDPPPTTQPAPEPAPVPDPAPPTTTPPASPPDLEWSPCGGAECATVSVPLDHASPQGDTIELFVSRLPARGDRIGSLFFNFGGPGASASDLIAVFPVPDAIRDRFDVVGVDPRGVGRSTPLRCGVDAVRLYAVDPTIEDRADVEALTDISHEYAADCAAEHGHLLPHLGTKAVARDLDLVRAAMGDEKLDYVGYSYGTSIGQAYAELFPDRVRTMILDGVVDPAPPGVDVATQQALGFETALSRWATGCPSRPTCGFDDPVGSVERMLALAEDIVPSAGASRPLGPGEAAIGLALPLYDRSSWPALDAAVSQALDGDGAAVVALADRYLDLVEFSIYFAVSCLDMTWPDRAASLLAAAERAGEMAPRFGEAIVNDYIRCTFWPTPPDPLGAIAAAGAPPILVVSTTGDPATPYENGVTVADRLHSGVLLTYEGEGHTIVFQGSRCVDRIASEYLIDRRPPAHAARC